MRGYLYGLVAIGITLSSADARAATKEEPTQPFSPKAGTVWVEPENGFESVNLRTFHVDTAGLSAGFLPTTSTGPLVGIGAGLRYSAFSIGAKARVGILGSNAGAPDAGSWQLWSINGELGFHIPIDRVEPYLAFGGGYTATSHFDRAIDGLAAGIDLRGADARAVLGVNVYVLPQVTVGAGVTGELLALPRPGMALSDFSHVNHINGSGDAQAEADRYDGSSFGTALTITGGAGFHF